METLNEVTLDDVVTQKDIIERFPFLTAQMLNKWRRKGLLRSIRGRGGVALYLRREIDLAIQNEFAPPPNPDAKRHERTRESDAEEAAKIREKSFVDSLSRRKHRGKRS